MHSCDGRGQLPETSSHILTYLSLFPPQTLVFCPIPGYRGYGYRVPSQGEDRLISVCVRAILLPCVRPTTNMGCVASRDSNISELGAPGVRAEAPRLFPHGAGSPRRDLPRGRRTAARAFGHGCTKDRHLPNYPRPRKGILDCSKFGQQHEDLAQGGQRRG